MNAFLPQEVRDFFLAHFIPEIIPLVKNVPVTFIDSFEILTRMSGMLIKILWAFLWQEQFLTPPWALKMFPLHIGATITPWVMKIGSEIDGIPQTSDYMIKGEHVYPGWKKCNVASPHALWH